jgi:Rrf2 family protein
MSMGYLVSTKGRYALRVMLDLSRYPDTLVPLKEIAERQEISLKYMETIMPCLKEAGFVTGTHGKGGGYKLTRPADTYTVGEILRATEGSMSPVACLDNGYICDRANECPTLPIWRKLDSMIKDYLDTVKLTDLLIEETSGDYVI